VVFSDFVHTRNTLTRLLVEVKSEKRPERDLNHLNLASLGSLLQIPSDANLRLADCSPQNYARSGI
jgi:hypothetical protein